MTSIENTAATPAKTPRTQQPELCPTCGKPLYECICPQRWENEGGAVLPEEGQDR